MTATMIEYRISWEMPPPIMVEAIEREYGDTVWRWKSWDELGLAGDEWWRSVERRICCTCDSLTCSAVERHAASLRRWSDDREHPIRNVRLEQREIEVGDWIEVDP